MTRSRPHAFLVLGAVVCTAARLEAANLVVSTATQLENAAFNAKAGDNILIRPGTYEVRNLTLRNSGTATAPITVRAATATRPVLETSGYSQSVISLTGQKNLVFRDLILRHANYGIAIGPDTLPRASDIRVENVEMYDFAGSAVRGRDYGVERMWINNCVVHDVRGTEGGFDFKINTHDSGCGAGSRRVLIQNCVFYHQTHQQSSGVIVQNSCADFIYINNVSRDNGEIAFASKAGGYNLYIGNVGFDQSKSAYYLRDPNKNEIQGCPPSNYLMINNVGITRFVMEGDQGAIIKWPDVNLWAFANTFVGLKRPETAFTGAPVVLSAPEDVAQVSVYLKNNVIFKAFSGRDVNIDGELNDISLRMAGNAFFVQTKNAADDIIRNHPDVYTLGQFLAVLNLPSTSLYGDPRFMRLDLNKDNVSHDLRPKSSSTIVGRGTPYVAADFTDYPYLAAVWLGNYQNFQNWSIMSASERATLQQLILTAHMYDRDGVPRPLLPTPGAYEPAAFTTP